MTATRTRYPTTGVTFGRGFSRAALAALVVVTGGALVEAGQDDDSPPEHPVIKPMRGATPSDSSTVEGFGRLTVNYRPDGGRSVCDEIEGQRWHLEYQLQDQNTSLDEIIANHESETIRINGEVLNRRATWLLFRVVRPGGGVTWCRLDARRNGRYELEIIDEAGLDLSVEFDADAMLEALNRDGRVAVYGILFDGDRADLRPGSGEVLDTIATLLKADAALRLEVQGHTDSTGLADRNRQLSQERAQAVVSALTLYGVASGRLIPNRFGADQPVGDNATDEGRQQNRRVELVRMP